MKKTMYKLLQPALVSTALTVSLLSASPAPAAKNNPEGKTFRHVATFDVMAGNNSAVAEIVDSASNGKQLVYTDSPKGEIGFVDIKNPAAPAGQGVVAVGGEPTSLAVFGKYVLVAVNTSPSYAAPSGKLVVVNLKTRSIDAEYDLGGQPDSIALAPDKKRAVVVLENERDEDLDDGLIPQNACGEVLIVGLKNNPERYTITRVDLSAVKAAAFAGADLEPEFVDINRDNKAVVSFQENNHLAVIDIKTATVLSHFSAGSVALDDVDSNEDDLISFDSSLTKRREPDAVTWIDENSFATANEGDYEDASGEEGGSRGFTIFNQNGTVEFESNASFEHLLASAGHYNEGRSENKGVEPEAVEFGVYGKGKHKKELLFVGSERSNAVGVYAMNNGVPEFMQVLPTGIGPEGLKALPARNLLVASTETDVADAGIPTMINIFELAEGPAYYPMIASEADGAHTIPWVALSGLAADPTDADTLYAVSDAFLAEGFIYAVDVSSQPAIIYERLKVTGASTDLDLEGIAVGPDGCFWAANEGNAKKIPNAIIKINPDNGTVVDEIYLPEDLDDEALSNGFEGIAVTGSAGSEKIYVVIQRAWPDAGDTDKVNTKIGRYDAATKNWTFVHYPLEAEGAGGWIGLSELTLLPNGDFAVIERDKGWGETTGLKAELKSIFMVDLAAADFKAYGETLATIGKELLVDVLPEIRSRSIWTAEKLEGFAVAADGATYCVTDNDGIDDAPGETLFFGLGNITSLLDN